MVAQMASITVVSVLVLYQPYREGILASERWIAGRPRRLAGFLGVIVAMPLVLLLV